ncbi:MAG: hypothetical protein ABMA02_01625 [Saprospiraceae bacterium]
MLQVSIFPTRSEAGMQLAQVLAERIAAYTGGLQPKVFNRFAQELTHSEFLEACLYDDLVIVDATREPDGINNYDIVNEHPKTMPYILVVSRNYLPINFYGVHQGGYPSYGEATKTNAQILAWFSGLLEKGILQPRPEEDKGLDIHDRMFRYLQEKERLRNEEGRIFISHRTKYQFDENLMGYKKNVRMLAEDIVAGKYHDGVSQTVKVLSNGELAYPTELLSPARKWQVYGMLDNQYILHCDEFWIYASRDYLDSWWCRAELVALAFVNDMHEGARRRRLRWYDPTEDVVYDMPETHYPQLTEAQKKRITRIYANTNPDSMGLESVKRIQQLRSVFGSIRQVPGFREKARNMFEQQMAIMGGGNKGPFKDAISKTDFDEVFNTFLSEEYLNDPVFQEEFWETLCYEAPWPEGGTRLRERFDLRFDVDRFLALSEPEHERIDPLQIRSGILYPKNGEPRPLRSEAPRYFWVPPRKGQDVSKHGDFLEKLPTWVL